jgi:CRP-like cAMP-binding protein
MPVEIAGLRQIAYFAMLDSDELAQVATVTVERHCDRGDLITREGERGGVVYYVRSGLIKVFKTSVEGKEQILHLIVAGQTFNEVPALDGGPNPASTASIEPSVIYVIQGALLRRLIALRPVVAQAIVQALATRLRYLVTLAETLSLRSVTLRVAKLLLDQEASFQEGDVVYRLTQQEMAALAGTVREVVWRALKELEAAEAIEMSQGRVVVVDREYLRLFISGPQQDRSSRASPR